MYCQAKEGLENSYVCMFTSKDRIVRQLLSVFTHQLLNSKESCPESRIKRLHIEAGVSGLTGLDTTHILCSRRGEEGGR